jgi:hypothetical protein
VTKTTIVINPVGPRDLTGQSLNIVRRHLKPGATIISTRGDIMVLTREDRWCVVASHDGHWSPGDILYGDSDELAHVVAHLYLTAEVSR